MKYHRDFITMFSQGGSDMLSPKVAQSIVDRTMAVLGVQVNIMDAQAVVIASGNTGRVGKFHAGAAKVLQSGKKLCISRAEAEKMEGVRPGITLPIEFKGKIIGAVGMAGDPEDVEDFGELLKLTAELMLEQASVKEELFLEQRAREGFLTDLITGHWREYDWHFARRAEFLSFDLNRVYLVMAAEIFDEQSVCAWREEQQGLPYQKLKAQLEERVDGEELYGGRLISCFVNGEMAILYQMPAKARMDAATVSRKAADAVYGLLGGGCGISASLGVGGLAEDWKEISAVYEDARSALRLNRILNEDRGVCWFETYRTEYLLSCAPAELRRCYWKKILDPVLKAEQEHGTQWIQTMETYFSNERNTVRTAEQLFLHRNTLMFRLNKIRELTGLAPQRFQDAMQLKLALLLMKMDAGKMDAGGEPHGKEEKDERLSGLEKRYGDKTR